MDDIMNVPHVYQEVESSISCCNMHFTISDEHKEIIWFFICASITLGAAIFAAGITSHGINQTNSQFLSYLFPGVNQKEALGIFLVPSFNLV